MSSLLTAPSSQSPFNIASILNAPPPIPIAGPSTHNGAGKMHTMDDFINIFGAGTPALSPARQDGRAGLLQQPVQAPPVQPMVTMPMAPGQLQGQADPLDLTTLDGMDGMNDVNMFDGLGFDDVGVLARGCS